MNNYGNASSYVSGIKSENPVSRIPVLLQQVEITAPTWSLNNHLRPLCQTQIHNFTFMNNSAPFASLACDIVILSHTSQHNFYYSPHKIPSKSYFQYLSRVTASHSCQLLQIKSGECSKPASDQSTPVRCIRHLMVIQYRIKRKDSKYHKWLCFITYCSIFLESLDKTFWWCTFDWEFKIASQWFFFGPPSMVLPATMLPLQHPQS